MLEWLGMPPAGSSHAGDVDRLMVLVHWLMAALFVGWSTFFLYVLVRFRRASHPTALHHGMRGRWSTGISSRRNSGGTSVRSIRSALIAITAIMIITQS